MGANHKRRAQLAKIYKGRNHHGLSGTAEHQTWVSMRQRCKVHRNYAGRGITVCEDWENSFLNFLADMGFRPSAKHSIDRIDNDGNYEPGNCRWATQSEQMANRRRPDATGRVQVRIGGNDVFLCEFCKEKGLSYAVVKGRLDLGWSIEKAIAEPVRELPPRRDDRPKNGDYRSSLASVHSRKPRNRRKKA